MSDTHCRYAFRVHGDVVKVAKPILQALEGRKELFASFHRPLGREQSGEEFRCIAQLFCLDAELCPLIPQRQTFVRALAYNPIGGPQVK